MKVNMNTVELLPHKFYTFGPAGMKVRSYCDVFQRQLIAKPGRVRGC